MKATSTLSTFLLLAGLYHTALAQQAQAPASSPDVASTSTLEQPPRPTLDTAAEWEKLVQQARVAVRLDYEAERAAEREQPASRPSGGDEKREGGIRIVRETVYLPYEGAQRGGEGGSGEAVIDGVSNAVLPSPPLVEEAPADIVRTVGKLRALRPIFTYAIHHPLRFLYRYALVPLLRSLLFLLSTILTILVYILLTLLSPIQTLLSVLFSPISALIAFNLSILPLWGMLGGALLAGAGLGAVAGLVAGRTTREIFDEGVRAARSSLIWVGALPKDDKPVEVGLKQDGFGAEARLETMSSVFGSSRATSQSAKAANAKSTTTTTTSSSSASPLPSRHFNPISAPSFLSAAPSAFSTSSSTAKSTFQPRKSRLPAFPFSLAAQDAPSSDLDARNITRAKDTFVEDAEESKGGWRERKVRL